MKLAAYMLSCIMDGSGATQCTVSHTEMNSVATNMTECTQQAAHLQDGALQSILITDLELRVVRRESACMSPAAAEKRATDEFNKLRSQGQKAILFAF